MRSSILFFLGEVVLSLSLSIPAFATGQNGEPAYCDPSTFSKYEVKYTGNSPDRLHVYKIGQLTLAGMAVGQSKVADVMSVDQHYASTVTSHDKYCQWYVNDGNSDAGATFDWHPLPKPSGSDYAGMTKQWMNIIGNEFDTSAINFVGCAQDFNYIGVGCDGQQHRGPSLFAMILSYAGCSPANSTAIANQIWGENGIKPQMREALAQAAADLATSHPEKAQILKDMMAK